MIFTSFACWPRQPTQNYFVLTTKRQSVACPLTGKRGRTAPAAGPHRSCAEPRPRSRATGFQLRPPPGTRCPLGPHHMEAGTLLERSLGTLPRAMAALPRHLDLGRCASRAQERTATSMPTTAYLEASPCFVRCTKTWDTSTCITRCAQSRAATRGRTMATQAARLSFALRTKTPVSLLNLRA